MTDKTSMTLRQGLEKFYQEHHGYLHHTKEDISNEAKAFFQSHDVAHVLFGCDISLFGEGSVKLWTLFGTTLGFRAHIKGYQSVNALGLAKTFRPLHFLTNLARLLVAVPSLLIRARRMHKPWPWAGYKPYLDVPISEIRREFNIRVL